VLKHENRRYRYGFCATKILTRYLMCCSLASIYSNSNRRLPCVVPSLNTLPFSPKTTTSDDDGKSPRPLLLKSLIRRAYPPKKYSPFDLISSSGSLDDYGTKSSYCLSCSNRWCHELTSARNVGLERICAEKGFKKAFDVLPACWQSRMICPCF
jgi:hypothetical protein